jgi:hypothetical protein
VELSQDKPLHVYDIAKHIQDGESFYLVSNEYAFGSDIIISITGHRLETDDERNERIQKLEEYNRAYEIFHSPIDVKSK